MSLWSWFAGLFMPSGGWLVRDGHELYWSRAALPLMVTMDPDLDGRWVPPIQAALRELSGVIGAPMFLGPSVAIPSLIAIWQDPIRRLGFTSSIHIQGGDVPATHAQSDIDYDTRTGEMRSVLITLPASPPGWAWEMALHELAHALGLDHSGEGVMEPVLRAGIPYALGADDRERLRRRYA